MPNIYELLKKMGLNSQENFLEFEEMLFSRNNSLSKKAYEKLVQAVMEIERDIYLQRDRYARIDKEINKEDIDYRNGYKPRTLNTTLGKLKLQVPQTRKKFSSSLFKSYQRSEQTIILACAEMYLNGVSTRKVSNLVEKVFGIEVSESTVSEYCKTIDKEITAWRNQPLEPYYKFLYLDATYIKVRVNNVVVSKACYIAIGRNKNNRARVLGVSIGDQESKSNWLSFIDSLRCRGLQKVDLIISDKNKGLVGAIEEAFTSIPWQRCIFHFKQNILNLPCKKKDVEMVKATMKMILTMPNKKEAWKQAHLQLPILREKGLIRIADEIENSIDEVTNFMLFDSNYRRFIRTSNILERLNQEIKRRTKSIRIFPNEASAMRVIGYILKEKDEKLLSKG